MNDDITQSTAEKLAVVNEFVRLIRRDRIERRYRSLQVVALNDDITLGDLITVNQAIEIVDAAVMDWNRGCAAHGKDPIPLVDYVRWSV